MGLSRNKVAVSEGAAGSPPFYGEHAAGRETLQRSSKEDKPDGVPEMTVVQFSEMNRKRSFWPVGDINAKGPPVPIPNTEVKLCSAENTSLETVRENRSLPTPFLRRGRDPDGGVAQLGEHLPCKQGVMGSNPIISTTL